VAASYIPQMSDDAGIRASDADRELATESLREHYAAGRLSSDELSARLEAAYRATTVSQLEALRGDLPQLPASPARTRAELAARRTELRRHLLQQAGGAFTPFVICTLIWAASGADAEFWPVWVLIFPAVFIVRNIWRLYGPAPELDRVQAELDSSRRHHRGGARGRHRRELR
jgi:Domain of unknown function (DUF1707)